MSTSTLMRSAGALVLTGLLAGLAACGSSASSTAIPASGAAQPGAGRPTITESSSARTGSHSSDAGSACSLVTPAEVGAAVGREMTTATGGSGVCVFQGSDPSSPFYLQVYANPAEMASSLELESSSIHLDGIGTDAFYTRAGGILFARNGDRAVVMTDLTLGLSFNDKPPPDGLVQLAKKVLAKL